MIGNGSELIQLLVGTFQGLGFANPVRRRATAGSQEIGKVVGSLGKTRVVLIQAALEILSLVEQALRLVAARESILVPAFDFGLLAE